MARPRGLPWLLAVLWLAAQQGALWHPLQHLQAGPASAAQASHADHDLNHKHDYGTDHDVMADAGCSLCLMLASLGAVAPPADEDTLARAPAAALPGRAGEHWPRTVTSAQHNRGPPAAG
jgi:hypothetical protein